MISLLSFNLISLSSPLSLPLSWLINFLLISLPCWYILKRWERRDRKIDHTQSREGYTRKCSFKHFLSFSPSNIIYSLPVLIPQRTSDHNILSWTVVVVRDDGYHHHFSVPSFPTLDIGGWPHISLDISSLSSFSPLYCHDGHLWEKKGHWRKKRRKKISGHSFPSTTISTSQNNSSNNSSFLITCHQILREVLLYYWPMASVRLSLFWELFFLTTLPFPRVSNILFPWFYILDIFCSLFGHTKRFLMAKMMTIGRVSVSKCVWE